jgi:hypothetical protein
MSPRSEFNSAAAIEDHVCIQSELPSIQHAVFDAVVRRQAHEVDVLDRSLLQIISESGMPSMRIIEKRTVTINVSLDALVENVSDSARVECRRKLGAVRVLNGVNRPENLFDAIEHDAVAGFFPGVICCEAAVIGRLPRLHARAYCRYRIRDESCHRSRVAKRVRE